MPKKRTHAKVRYLKNTPHYLVKIPWVVTHGHRACPCEYNNCLHAAVHSLLAAMTSDDMDSIKEWLAMARTQLNAAIRTAAKPGAQVPVVGAFYDAPEDK